ncbi:trehalose utilization protein ThuA [Capsulimonas corticalis]|uniref:Trehalose utilization protein ThuA n=1 Tax=Capsulimonas corticalis TaxID=2219043 RepID=A0A402CX77_9BACT|nr:ThuA domain-containing protein [Capsulimonas corticalis]BDI32375.1 trehalose utilization protein ThuA [Capsulimonas corticalis]
MSEQTPVKVLVWDEAPTHAPREVYPQSINGAIAAFLNEDGAGQIVATTANIDDPEQGLSEQAIADADVIIWWGHARHDEVQDELAQRVVQAVHAGTGFIPLHSAHYSKTFRGVLSATGHLKGGWREQDENPDTEEITVCAPKHPIAEGVEDFTLPREEMYGAPFDVPPFKTVVFQSYFPVGGEYFPSFATSVGEGITPDFHSGGGKGENQGEGAGRVFYFRPGHETFPTYFDPSVRRILRNAVLWTARRTG